MLVKFIAPCDEPVWLNPDHVVAVRPASQGDGARTRVEHEHGGEYGRRYTGLQEPPEVVASRLGWDANAHALAVALESAKALIGRIVETMNAADWSRVCFDGDALTELAAILACEGYDVADQEHPDEGGEAESMESILLGFARPIEPRPCLHNGYHQPGQCPEAEAPSRALEGGES